MELGVTPRPTSITLIGWLAISLGAMSILSAVGGLAVSLAMPSLGDAPEVPGVYFPTWLFRHYAALCLVQVGVAGLAVVGGIFLLRLKPWARTVVEGISWVGLLALIAFGVLWTRTAASMTAHFPAQEGVSFPSTLFTGMGVMITLILVVPFVVVIRTLRGSAVRAAMHGAATTDAPAGT
jgi:hypothetical protein